MQGTIPLIIRYMKNEPVLDLDLKVCIQSFVDFSIMNNPRILRSPDGSLHWTGDRNFSIYDKFIEKSLLETII